MRRRAVVLPGGQRAPAGLVAPARCRGCRKTCAAADLAPAVQAKRVPHCDCGGVWKPQVTFFGEDLPNRVAFKLEEDRERALVMLKCTV